MSPPLSFSPHHIEINNTDNRHFALVYLLGITRLTFTRSTAQEPSIYLWYYTTIYNFLMIWTRQRSTPEYPTSPASNAHCISYNLHIVSSYLDVSLVLPIFLLWYLDQAGTGLIQFSDLVHSSKSQFSGREPNQGQDVRSGTSSEIISKLVLIPFFIQ